MLIQPITTHSLIVDLGRIGISHGIHAIDAKCGGIRDSALVSVS